MKAPLPTILVVDDDRGLLRLIQKALQRAGCSAVAASSGKQAIDWLAEHRADLMLLDLKLQDIEGKELVNHLASVDRSVPFIVITGQGDERVAVDMMKRGARDYLVKDVDFLEFVPEVVRRALDQLGQERRLALAEEQARLGQTVVEQGYTAVLITTPEDTEARVIYVNPAFTTLIGCSASEITGERLSHLEAMIGPIPELRRALSEGRPFSGERSIRRRDGTPRIVDSHITPVLDAAGRRTHWVLIQRDITDHKRLEKEVLEISEREQRRIGQELHDGLGQQLTAIELLCESLRIDLASVGSKLEEQAAQVCQFLRKAIMQTRSLAHGLARFKVEADGLQAALADLAQVTSSIGRLNCRIHCPAPVLLDDSETATHLYRIAQEAVNNALKHSQASEVTIDLSQRNGALRMEVRDNGRGLSKSAKSTPGMGLQAMKHRAGVIGALLEMKSAPGKGVTVACRLRRSE